MKSRDQAYCNWEISWAAEHLIWVGRQGLAVPTANALSSVTHTGVNLASIMGGVPTAAAAALVIPPSVLTAFQSRNNFQVARFDPNPRVQ